MNIKAFMTSVELHWLMTRKVIHAAAVQFYLNLNSLRLSWAEISLELDVLWKLEMLETASGDIFAAVSCKFDALKCHFSNILRNALSQQILVRCVRPTSFWHFHSFSTWVRPLGCAPPLIHRQADRQTDGQINTDTQTNTVAVQGGRNQAMAIASSTVIHQSWPKMDNKFHVHKKLWTHFAFHFVWEYIYIYFFFSLFLFLLVFNC